MKVTRYFSLAAIAGLSLIPYAWAQENAPKHISPADLSTDNLLSESGPTFKIADSALPSPVTVIAFGDQRFTDPTNVKVTNPRVRKWLVDQIAEAKPGAVILNGDVPYSGDVVNDYAVYRDETKPWRDEHLNVFPALGNHEFHGDPSEALEHWWSAFPELRNRRWYSAQLGSRIYLIQLDSDAPLLPGSNQARWLDGQIKGLPASVDFVIISMHHPPVADVQKRINVDHNPRPNEIALRDYLTETAKTTHARFLVSAGHIHNYERHMYENVLYLVAGGGAAHPVYVERTPDDLYRSELFPNYHFVKFTLEADKLHGAMYRVEDPEASALELTVKDEFDIPANGRTTASR